LRPASRSSCELSIGCPPVLTEEAEGAEASVIPEDRMDMHKNARLTPFGRERMVRAILEGGQTPQAAGRIINRLARGRRHVLLPLNSRTGPLGLIGR